MMKVQHVSHVNGRVVVVVVVVVLVLNSLAWRSPTCGGHLPEVVARSSVVTWLDYGGQIAFRGVTQGRHEPARSGTRTKGSKQSNLARW